MKTNSNLIKSKLETIAEKFIKQKEEDTSYLLLNKLKEESKQNELNLSNNTLKDSFTCLEQFKDSLNKINIKKYGTFKNISEEKNNSYKSKKYSSICSKGTVSSDNNIADNIKNDKSILDNNEIINNDNLIDNQKIIKNENYINDGNENNKIINILLNRINCNKIKDLKIIYEQLISLFNGIKYISNNENNNKINGGINNNDNNNNNFIIKSKILCFHYIKILLNKDIEKINKLFYESIEINKFLLYQIYICLSIIYLNEEKLNEYILLSYKTILLYSSRNFENIFNILLNYSLFNNERINKNIISLNKIIISILKTLTNIPSNSQIMYYITPIKENIENNFNNNLEDKIENRISGIYNLLILLKENKDLNEKLILIEKKENELIEEEENNKNNKEYEEQYNNKILKDKIILPDIDNNKYKYSVIIELDETLVHYCEENDNYFVKVRFESENFMDYIHNFCEIIIVSTSGDEYSDIIINNLNKNKCIIDHRIYTEEYKDFNLSEINRDFNKTFIICHNDNFFNAPKSNIIKLNEFDGDENDKEFSKLKKEFKKIENMDINDIRDIIFNIRKNFINDVKE